jgi:O-methyltransferase
MLNVVRNSQLSPAPPEPGLPVELLPIDHQIITRVRPFTMTSPERLAALIKAVRYVAAANIPGDFVECGVWRGGSMMAVALTLLALNIRNRRLFLFDTFQGMPPPSQLDVDHRGLPASAQMHVENVHAFSPLDDVRAAMAGTAYPPELIHFVQGKVEDTLPAQAPAQIALLRLDTDWYDSTRHELVHLYPRLSTHGALIIDDYGHWQGARRAVDEYFSQIPILLNVIDFTGRIAIKT